MAKNGFRVFDCDMHVVEPWTSGSDISSPNTGIPHRWVRGIIRVTWD